MSGVPTKPMIMFTVVRPTPTMKLAHGGLADALAVQAPQHRTEEGAGKSAPGDAHELGDQVTEALVLEHGDERRDGDEDDEQRANPDDLLRFSFISLTMLPLIKSSVSTELEVSTSEDSVLIDAEHEHDERDR